MALTASLEDYLEAIFEIDKSKQDVRVKDVAQKLGVTMPSVNGALKNLEAKGLIVHEKYNHIELTEAGVVLASKVASKHSMIFLFLREILNVDEKTAQEDACKIEHVLSRDTVDKMTEYIDRSLKNSELDTHSKKAVITDSNKSSMVTVNDLLPGEWGFIKKIMSSDSIRQRVMDFGITEGVRIEMIRSAPLGDPVQIKVRGTLLAMRRSEASMLVIERKGERHHGRKPHRHRFGRKSKQR